MCNNHNILICPLEWGLGHAARMIPLARKLLEMNNNVFIASGEEHLSLFRSELTGLHYIEFSGFKPVYSRFLPQYVALLLKTPVLFYHIIREHLKLKKIILEYSIDIIISDNRFGLWNKDVKTVYITHMPLIPFPKPFRFFEFIGVYMHRFIIRKYTLCFVPDLPGKTNLSGRLSHDMRLPGNVRYIGILSRFSGLLSTPHSDTGDFRHNTIILSGPEPQRTILKKKLTRFLKEQSTLTVILEGKPEKEKSVVRSDNILYYNHLPSAEMAEIIAGSECIITRAGYTTVMDLISLNRSALLIPTPGQTEQEYLAEYLSGKGWFSTISQKRIEKKALSPSDKTICLGEIAKQSNELLEKALNELLEEPHEKT